MVLRPCQAALLAVALLLLTAVAQVVADGHDGTEAHGPSQYQPFVNGVDGYRDYRIPSLLHLDNGDLLLFCEARGPDRWQQQQQQRLTTSAASGDWTTDGGPTDIVTRRSTDDGQSWGNISVVHSETTQAKVVTIGNPAPVALTSHPNMIVLTFCRDNLDVAVMKSSDNGASWTEPTYVIHANSASFRQQLAVTADKNVSHIATVSALLNQVAAASLLRLHVTRLLRT